MKKISIILLLSSLWALQTIPSVKAPAPTPKAQSNTSYVNNLIEFLSTQDETLTTKPILNQKPQLVYIQIKDITAPKKRNGQYLRTGEVKAETTKNKMPYFFGEYIDKTTRARSIVIEEANAPSEDVYKIIHGCTNTCKGYIKEKNKTIALYSFDPSQANFDAISKKYIQEMVDWATGANENKPAPTANAKK